jgi:hypothetical protein
MAGMVTASRLPEPEEFDYSKSHRNVPVPVPSVAYNATTAERAPFAGEQPGRPRDKDEAGSVRSEGRRRGSFSFLHRSTSSQQKEKESVPPVPSTRIAQAHIDAAAAAAAKKGSYDGNHTPPGQVHARAYSTASSAATDKQGSRKTSLEGSVGKKMLRKSSKMKKEEQGRLAREAAAANALPKHPPRLSPLPSIGNLGAGSITGDDSRPDSYAIFNNPHGLSQTANFSRPGVSMPAYNSYGANSSSSPATYAVRPGNAFSPQAASSSPSVAARSANGEYVDNAYDRTESMTHRGRYSYASSTAQVNVNSPRRVRRRKDPTPFK